MPVFPAQAGIQGWGVGMGPRFHGDDGLGARLHPVRDPYRCRDQTALV